ncbi:MAG: manganese catalase family protein [Bacillota bacterium]
MSEAEKTGLRFIFPPKGKQQPGPPADRPRRFCELDLPYPEPRVAAPNRYYAELLLEDYAGPLSELTAIHQYIYHDFTFHEEYPELAELEECISIVEMRHLELLAETILLLGVAPRFWFVRENRFVYWNASFPYYGKNVCDRLAADIAAEENAIEQYRAHQKAIKDPYIDGLLQRIILDEEHHLKLFTEAYNKHCRDKR